MEAPGPGEFRQLLQQLSAERQGLNQKLEEIKEKQEITGLDLSSQGLEIAEKLNVIDLRLKQLRKRQKTLKPQNSRLN